MHSEWTAIDYDNATGLPMVKQNVLLTVDYMNGQPRFVAEGWLESEREYKWCLEATDAYNDHIELHGLEVTHWMPKPDPAPTGSASTK